MASDESLSHDGEFYITTNVMRTIGEHKQAGKGGDETTTINVGTATITITDDIRSVGFRRMNIFEAINNLEAIDIRGL